MASANSKTKERSSRPMGPTQPRQTWKRAVTNRRRKTQASIQGIVFVAIGIVRITTVLLHKWMTLPAPRVTTIEVVTGMVSFSSERVNGRARRSASSTDG